MNEEDVEKLEAMFIKQEEENFALFNYVNELNHEMETLSTNIELLKTEIGSSLAIFFLLCNNN